VESIVGDETKTTKTRFRTSFGGVRGEGRRVGGGAPGFIKRGSASEVG